MIDFRTYRALSFDCYGTLIDWEAGIGQWASEWTARSGGVLNAKAFLASFSRQERVVQSKSPTLRYPEILAEVARRIAAEHDLAMKDEDAASFGASVGNWPAFPDSTASLRALAERYKLIILSNVDRSSFARSNERLQVKFDVIITAQDVGSYKPDPQNFDTLLATVDGMGIAKHELLHVGESLYHDILPANRDGIDCVWIDRGHAGAVPRASGPVEAEPKPLATYHSMHDFAKAALNGGFA